MKGWTMKAAGILVIMVLLAGCIFIFSERGSFNAVREQVLDGTQQVTPSKPTGEFIIEGRIY